METIGFRGEGTVEFGEVLQRLKQEGCNLLVTGEVPVVVSDAATRRLLGAPFEKRRRILAFTDAGVERVPSRLPGGCRPGDRDVTVIEQTEDTRSTAVERTGGGRFDVTGVGPGLGSLEAAILDAVAAYERTGLEPSELRLSLDSVRLLVDDHGVEPVHSFLESVGVAVAEARGMAHYHMPLPDDSPSVDALSCLFDARIELRKRDGFAPEQRWHVTKYGLTTEWVGL